jgi:hypothetical protein
MQSCLSANYGMDVHEVCALPRFENRQRNEILNKSMKLASKTLLKVLACTAVALGAASLAYAQTAKVDPTGTWTWTGGGGGRGGPGGGGGGARGGGMAGTNTLVLKLDADGTKVTGTLQSPARGRRGGPNGGGADANAPATPPPAPAPVQIQAGKFVASTATLTFNIVQPGRNGGEDTTINYKGTVTADKITGTVTRPGRNGGDPMETEWIATKK